MKYFLIILLFVFRSISTFADNITVAQDYINSYSDKTGQKHLISIITAINSSNAGETCVLVTNEKWQNTQNDLNAIFSAENKNIQGLLKSITLDAAPANARSSYHGTYQ